MTRILPARELGLLCPMARSVQIEYPAEENSAESLIPAVSHVRYAVISAAQVYAAQYRNHGTEERGIYQCASREGRPGAGRRLGLSRTNRDVERGSSGKCLTRHVRES